MDKSKHLLAYAILLIRNEENQKAIDVLKRAEKAKDLTPDGRNQMLTHYAIAAWKLGHLDRALEILEALYRKNPTGYLYGTLGFLKIEQGDLEEALRFNQEAVEYDDEDAVCLDNLGQAYYRLAGDKESARPYFEKALEQKPTAIDTNYFLALYDLEEGKEEEAKQKLQTALEGRFSPLNYVTKEMVEEKLAPLREEEEGES